MKIKLLFQGDSITDAGRSYEDPHLLGEGYVKYAAKYLQEAYPNCVFRLEVEEENVGAVALYKKKGFRFLPYKQKISYSKNRCCIKKCTT